MKGQMACVCTSSAARARSRRRAQRRCTGVRPFGRYGPCLRPEARVWHSAVGRCGARQEKAVRTRTLLLCTAALDSCFGLPMTQGTVKPTVWPLQVRLQRARFLPCPRLPHSRPDCRSGSRRCVWRSAPADHGACTYSPFACYRRVHVSPSRALTRTHRSCGTPS